MKYFLLDFSILLIIRLRLLNLNLESENLKLDLDLILFRITMCEIILRIELYYGQSCTALSYSEKFENLNFSKLRLTYIHLDPN